MGTINVTMRAEQLHLALQSASAVVKEKVAEGVASLSYAIFTQGRMYAQERLTQTRLQYINALKYKVVGYDQYLIYLEDDTDYLESGYSSFDQKPGLLNGPKSRPMKGGGRYTVVPFSHKRSAGSATNLHEQLMATEVRQALGKARDVFGSATDLRKTQMSPMTGRPMQGKVGRVVGTDMHQNLQGLTKYQKTYEKTTQSQLMTFRTVSSRSKPNSWIHPGFRGAGVFPSLQVWAQQEIDNLLKKLL